MGHRRLRGPGRREYRLGRPRPGRRGLARRVRRDRGSDQHGRSAPEGRGAGHGARRRVDVPARGDALRLGGAGAVRAQGQAGRGHRVPGDRRACGSGPSAWRAGPRDAVRRPRRAARRGSRSRGRGARRDRRHPLHHRRGGNRQEQAQRRGAWARRSRRVTARSAALARGPLRLVRRVSPLLALPRRAPRMARRLAPGTGAAAADLAATRGRTPLRRAGARDLPVSRRHARPDARA